jgi:hypothetical protein
LTIREGWISRAQTTRIGDRNNALLYNFCIISERQRLYLSKRFKSKITYRRLCVHCCVVFAVAKCRSCFIRLWKSGCACGGTLGRNAWHPRNPERSITHDRTSSTLHYSSYCFLFVYLMPLIQIPQHTPCRKKVPRRSTFPRPVRFVAIGR